jgi:hypothetical protein
MSLQISGCVQAGAVGGADGAPAALRVVVALLSGIEDAVPARRRRRRGQGGRRRDRRAAERRRRHRGEAGAGRREGRSLLPLRPQRAANGVARGRGHDGFQVHPRRRAAGREGGRHDRPVPRHLAVPGGSAASEVDVAVRRDRDRPDGNAEACGRLLTSLRVQSERAGVARRRLRAAREGGMASDERRQRGNDDRRELRAGREHGACAVPRWAAAQTGAPAGFYGNSTLVAL